jgi:hypothetical protein
MEYQVPQFIEVEDKVFGPLSIKQFIYLAGGAGLCVVLALYVPKIGILLAIPVGLFAAGLAFYKVHNKPLVDVLESAFSFFLGGRLYLWKKEDHIATPEKPKVVAPTPTEREQMGLTRGKLHDLAWSLDVKDNPPQ